MKIIAQSKIVDFNFNKYCKLMVEVVPREDLLGIEEINFVEKYSHPKSDKDAFGYYLQGKNGNSASIEINISNIVKERISAFNFIHYPEVAALLLSQTIFHEFGHHAYMFKRHGIRKSRVEDFADKYAEACYYRYLHKRKSKILASYRWASLNIFKFDKEGRNKCREAR